MQAGEKCGAIEALPFTLLAFWITCLFSSLGFVDGPEVRP